MPAHRSDSNAQLLASGAGAGAGAEEAEVEVAGAREAAAAAGAAVDASDDTAGDAVATPESSAVRRCRLTSG